MTIRLFGIFLLFLLCKNTFAQKELSNFRIKKITATDNWQVLDSLTIAPETVKIYDEKSHPVSPFNYQLSNNKIKFSKTLKNRIFTLQYRVLPFNLGNRLFRVDTSLFSKKNTNEIIAYNPFEKENTLPDFGKLSYTGSFSRGIAFGNSQNPVLNSALNLQMAGNLTNDIEILAAVTDNNIPLQPEGNTAQLQEFDKVFIQLKRKESTLIAGDYELKRPDRYFINYLKKLQGATFSNTASLSEKGDLKTKASVAIARGKFARNILPVQEGNQGPYRLRGNENERFIIALAGTEKVYLNGILLERGSDADYIIDYNAASVIFTYRRPVNKDSRLVVEFEYTDQSYLRSLATIDLDYESKNADYYFTFYSDRDSKNSIASGELSDSEKLLLAAAGDGLSGQGNATSSGIFREEEFNALRVNYTLTDTIICGRTDSILHYSTAAAAENYTARFSLVGQGNGNYILDTEQAANGRVYRWVPPINCLPQGNYEPILVLTAPKQQQVFSGGTKIRFSKNASLHMEGSLSNFDLNRFSLVDDEDNRGLAGFTEYQQVFDLKKKLSLSINGTYEIRNQNFNFLNRYRPQEFTRDWNLSQVLGGRLGTNDSPKAKEHWREAGLTLKKENRGSLEYNFGNFIRKDIYSGKKHFSKIALSRNEYDVNIEGSFLQSKTKTERTGFFRSKIHFEKHFLKRKKLKSDIPESLPSLPSKVKKTSGIWSVGFTGEREDNRRYELITDTLNATSFHYDFLKTFVKYEGNKKIHSSLTSSRRWDYLPAAKQNSFESTAIADDLNWSGNWRQAKTSNLNWSLNYRNLTVKKANSTAQQSGATYLGRLSYNWSLKKSAIRSETNYQISSGQEPKIEFNYLRVNDGEGVYQWNDYNGDLIPQQNEFETAVFQDSANFVRVSIFTDEFIRSNNALFNQSLLVNPKSIWKNSKGIRKVLSRFSEQSTLQIARRVRNIPGISQWNPFELNIIDTALVALNSNMRNTLFFNRGNRLFDLQTGVVDLQNRVVITTGFEARKSTERFIQGRWNISKKWIFKVKIHRLKQKNDSENFDDRDFEIETSESENSIARQQNNQLRVLLKHRYRTAKNKIGILPENLLENNWNLEAVYNFSGKKKNQPTSIRLSMTFAKVDFTGKANSPAGFTMLRGLRNGQNFLWTLNLERQLFNNIRLSLNYEGRKTGSSRIVHVGRAQVAAVF